MRHDLARSIVALFYAAAALPAQGPPYLLTRSADRLTICSILADSFPSNVARGQLPAAKPRGELTLVRTPIDAELGRVIHSSVLVRPDGGADTTTVVVIGTADSAYRRDFTRTMARIPFLAPMVNGCAVWGRFWLEIERDGEFRERP